MAGGRNTIGPATTVAASASRNGHGLVAGLVHGLEKTLRSNVTEELK